MAPKPLFHILYTKISSGKTSSSVTQIVICPPKQPKKYKFVCLHFILSGIIIIIKKNFKKAEFVTKKPTISL